VQYNEGTSVFAFFNFLPFFKNYLEHIWQNVNANLFIQHVWVKSLIAFSIFFLHIGHVLRAFVHSKQQQMCPYGMKTMSASLSNQTCKQQRL